MIFHVLNRGVGRMELFSKPADYVAFEQILQESLAKCPLRICAYCVMPNHWHFLVWPENEGERAAFMQRLTVTHATRWQKYRRRVGYGHVYQARYKSFPVESDEHFFHVARYVERNPLRANLVTDPLAWRWSSLWRREHGSQEDRAVLAPWPLPWPAHVAAPQSEVELAALRHSVQRGKPYGSTDWVHRMAKELGLESTLRHPHRPRKFS